MSARKPAIIAFNASIEETSALKVDPDGAARLTITLAASECATLLNAWKLLAQKPLIVTFARKKEQPLRPHDDIL